MAKMMVVCSFDGTGDLLLSKYRKLSGEVKKVNGRLMMMVQLL